ncbi:MAG: DUF1579 family protein, partial [Planctomycetota bacterium]
TTQLVSSTALLAIGAAAGIGLYEGVGTATATLAQPEGDMTQEQMMAEWEKMGQPGEHHKKLDRFTGEYDVQATFMMPDGGSIESGGSLTSEWVLGGRFVHGDFHLDNMMGPFDGISYVGYDNQTGEYVSIWLDSMSTKAYVHEARFEGDVFITEGEGATGPMRIVSTPKDDGSVVDEFYEKDPSGAWYRSGTMVYTRK